MHQGTYANGQIKSETSAGQRTHYFKDGRVKATGPVDEQGRMQGEWQFYKQSGYLWQIGHLKDDLKDGDWQRFGATGQQIYQASFVAGKQLKPKKERVK